MSNQKKAGEVPSRFPDEIAHLAGITRMLGEAFGDCRGRCAACGSLFIWTPKRYMAKDYRGKSINGCFPELFTARTDGPYRCTGCQNPVICWQSPERVTVFLPASSHRKWQSASRPLCASGAFTFRHNSELLVFDWRACFQHVLRLPGRVPCHGYDSPMGRVEGYHHEKTAV